MGVLFRLDVVAWAPVMTCWRSWKKTTAASFHWDTEQGKGLRQTQGARRALSPGFMTRQMHSGVRGRQVCCLGLLASCHKGIM